jgi:lysophospholipid acyltransferase (LPLAT)-like uncharacterized protein
MLNRLLKSQALRRAGAAALGAYLSFTLRTTRWSLDGADNLEPFVAEGGVVAAFWHECLPVMPALWGRVLARNPARLGRVLISQHRDGQLIATVMRAMNIEVVHGSSGRDKGGKRQKGGAGAMRACLAALDRGEVIVVTPDGPRGPPRRAAAGVAQLAALSGVPVLPCAGRLRHHVRLASWDRMIVPLPFGRGVLVCLPAMHVAGGAAALATEALDLALTRAADRAEALCR